MKTRTKLKICETNDCEIHSNKEQNDFEIRLIKNEAFYETLQN